MMTQKYVELKANRGIPHSYGFEKTAEGFVVYFKKMPERYFTSQQPLFWMSMLVWGSLFLICWGVYGLGDGHTLTLVAIMVIQITIGRGCRRIYYYRKATTRVEVTRDWILIDMGSVHRKLNREDFGGFYVHHQFNCEVGKKEVLGVSYGTRGLWFGGAFNAGDGTEVASALNHHLRLTAVPDESSPSPEQLGAARASAF